MFQCSVSRTLLRYNLQWRRFCYIWNSISYRRGLWRAKAAPAAIQQALNWPRFLSVWRTSADFPSLSVSQSASYSLVTLGMLILFHSTLLLRKSSPSTHPQIRLIHSLSLPLRRGLPYMMSSVHTCFFLTLSPSLFAKFVYCLYTNVDYFLPPLRLS